MISSLFTIFPIWGVNYLMEGKTLLHYEILELLGRGAMGTVYRARDTRLDTYRALKFIQPDLLDL